MRKLIVALAVALSPLAVSAQGEMTLQYSGRTVGYASAKPDGGLAIQQAWEGYKLVKRADGSCYRIEHRNLRIENVGNGQRPHFDETVMPVSCEPTTLSLAAPSGGTVLSITHVEVGGTVVPLVRTKKADGSICQEYISHTTPLQTEGTSEADIRKSEICEEPIS